MDILSLIIHYGLLGVTIAAVIVAIGYVGYEIGISKERNAWNNVGKLGRREDG